MSALLDPIRLNQLNPPDVPSLEAIFHAYEASAGDRRYTLRQILGLIADATAPKVPASRVAFDAGDPEAPVDLQALLADILARAVFDAGEFGAALSGAEIPEEALAALGVSPYFATLLGADDVGALLALLGIGQVTQGYIFGLTTANNAVAPANEIDFADGEAASEGPSPVLLMPGPMTKSLAAEWSAGSGAGGRVAGQSLADGTWHAFAFRRSNGADDFCLSNTLSFTLPDGGTHRRRLASLRRAGGSIVAYRQAGDAFEMLSPAPDVSVTDPGIAAVLRPLSVPAGIEVEAVFTAAGFNGAGTVNHTLITSPLVNDTAPSSTNFTFRGVGSSMSGGSGQLRVRTNTSRQVRTRSDVSNANQTLVIMTHGWIDARGRST